MEEALPILEQAIQEQPGSAREHTELGRVLLHMGKRELAAARLEKAVALDPGSTAARLLLGRTYLELDRKEQGEQQLRLGQENRNQPYRSPDSQQPPQTPFPHPLPPPPSHNT